MVLLKKEAWEIIIAIIHYRLNDTLCGSLFAFAIGATERLILTTFYSNTEVPISHSVRCI